MGDAADFLEEQEFNLHNLPETHRRRPEPTWKTRDGELLKISEMRTSHIQNCIKMLERALSQRPLYTPYMGDSSYAEDAVEAEERHNEILAEGISNQIELFNKELKKRGVL